MDGDIDGLDGIGRLRRKTTKSLTFQIRNFLKFTVRSHRPIGRVGQKCTTSVNALDGIMDGVDGIMDGVDGIGRPTLPPPKF